MNREEHHEVFDVANSRSIDEALSFAPLISGEEECEEEVLDIDSTLGG